MNRILFVLAVTAGRASAAPGQLVLQPAPRTTQPTLATGAAQTCEGPYVTQRRVIGTATIAAVHGCMPDDMSVLLIHSAGGWFASDGVTIAYVGANMTEAPLHITLLSERLSTGAIADGTPAIVHTVETLHRAITTCYSERCTPTVVSVERHGMVQVCTLDADPACAIVSMTCTAEACPSARLSKGMLAFGDERLAVVRK